MFNSSYTLKKCWVVLAQFWVKNEKKKKKTVIGLIFLIQILTQCLSLSIFDPHFGLKQPGIFYSVY